MRLKSQLWIQAYLQKLAAAMIPVFIVRRGDESAGAIFIKISFLDGLCAVYAPVPAGFNDSQPTAHDDRLWANSFPDKQLTEREADQWLTEQASYDSDLWVIEVEDSTGNHHLDPANITEI